mmetsp:Transcript_5779/g.20222  ORF Transcript_5779/g.20222 Transcript_5779/m.20222 type:complete len:84 (+) Transcript_5779:686-937(+)
MSFQAHQESFEEYIIFTGRRAPLQAPCSCKEETITTSRSTCFVGSFPKVHVICLLFSGDFLFLHREAQPNISQPRTVSQILVF